MHGWSRVAAGRMLTWRSRRSSRRFVHAVLGRVRGRFSGLDSRALGILDVQRSLLFALLAEGPESRPGDRVPSSAFGDRRYGRTNWNWPARKNRRSHDHHHRRREEERIGEKPRVPAIAWGTEPERLPKAIGAAKRVVAVKAVKIRSKVPIPVPSGLIVLVVYSVAVGIAGSVIRS